MDSLNARMVATYSFIFTIVGKVLNLTEGEDLNCRRFSRSKAANVKIACGLLNISRETTPATGVVFLSVGSRSTLICFLSCRKNQLYFVNYLLKGFLFLEKEIYMT